MNKQEKFTNLFVWSALFVAVISVSLIADSMSDSVNREVEGEYKTYQSLLAQSSAKTLRLFFTEVETELRLLSKDPELQTMPRESATRKVESLARRHRELIEGAFLVDAIGNVVVGPLWINQSPAFLTHTKELYRHLLMKSLTHIYPNIDSGRSVLSEIPFSSKYFEGFTLAVPILTHLSNGDEVINGMVVALVSKKLLLSNLLSPIEFKDQSSAFVFTHSPRIMLFNKQSQEKVLNLFYSLSASGKGAELLKRMRSGASGTDIVNIWHKGDRLPDKVMVSFADAPIANVVWTVGIMTPLGEITKIVQKSRIQSLLLASFVSAVLYIGAIVILKINKSRVVAKEKAAIATELAEKNEELKKLSAMKDEFVSIVSHDLRSPISTILGFSKLLLPQLEKAEIKTKPLDAIIRSSQRLLTLINDILDLARVEAGKLELSYSQVNINNLVQESFKAVEFNAKEKGIKLFYLPGEEPVTVDADNNKIYQVVNNLLINAIKFTPDDGSVTVRKLKDNDNLVISVADTGVGIPLDKINLIFDKYEQSTTHEGSGLGLAICKNFIELHGGKIWVESKESEGADFKFQIPIDKIGKENESTGN